ncbi:MAG: PAS domain S-box protein, partial [Pseudomonadales bacterium]|nr:PAS domain S-box protein [Pseudomonadales bacterium]
SGLRQDGTEFPVEIALAPLPVLEGRERVMAVVVDITARKRYEQALEFRTRQLERSNRELDSFAYVASHDLRSPLRGIDNLCTWIREDLGEDVSEDVGEHLELMQNRIDRMEAMLEDLLEYSRVGRNKEHPEKVDVRELIENTVDLLAPPEGFDVRLEGELPVFETLSTPLSQVFRNLINNAIKHHDKENGTIVVGARELDDRYEFFVADDGPGIEPRYRERVFRMFSTLRPRDEVEGSGLGLAMISKIVEAWRGSVWIEDHAEGRGCVFRFTWPKSIRLEDEMAGPRALVEENS